MQNKNLPAYPCKASMPMKLVNGEERIEDVDTFGITKREMFAMNAPECPVSFRIAFKNREFDPEIHDFGHEMIMIDGKVRHSDMRLTLAGELELLRVWGYAYADAMLREE